MQVSGIPLYALMLISSAIGAEEMTHAQKASHVPFPESYRSWQLVKSIVVGPDSPLSAMRGGIHHYYANPAAIIGYQTGKFPDGAVIVDEAMWMKAGEGMAKGIWMENEVRFLEVMSKDAALYSTSGGWGYQRFEGDDHQGKLDADGQAHCFACHEKAKDDHVYSSLRP